MPSAAPMVIKGGSRGRAGELAKHLQRTDTNEHMNVREVRGVVAGNIDDALREMEAVSAGARSRKPFYHASINTPSNEPLSETQKTIAIDRLEAKLGLTGQPRVVVEHVKEGRAHIHVAWSRIDGETLHAIPDSHNYRKHEEVARSLEQEFGHARVQGAHHDRGEEERPKRRPSHAETRQAERSGMTPEDAKAQLRELWGGADGGKSFTAALDDAGWILAQGDKRGFVALDPAGEARAVNKDITGLTAAKVRERLADIDPATLPSVDEARARQRQRTQEQIIASEPVIATPAMAPKIAPKPPGLAQESSCVAVPSLSTGEQLVPPPALQAEAKSRGQALELPEEPAERQPTQKPATERQPEVSLLRQVLDRARERLDALGNRLEAAFDRFRQIIDRKPPINVDPLEEARRRLTEREKAQPPNSQQDESRRLFDELSRGRSLHGPQGRGPA